MGGVDQLAVHDRRLSSNAVRAQLRWELFVIEKKIRIGVPAGDGRTMEGEIKVRHYRTGALRSMMETFWSI